MDDKEKNHIQKNLLSLTKGIKCSEDLYNRFIYEDLITEADVQDIEAKRTDTAKASELLRTIQNRVRSYQVLCLALEDTKQTGPLSILRQLEGYTVVAVPNTFVPAKLDAAQNADNLTESIIVGDKDCPIPLVINVIQDNPVGHKLQDKVGDLARRLLVPIDERNRIQNSLKNNSIDYLDATEKVLESWRAQSSKQTKLSVLLKALTTIQLKELADVIEKEIKDQMPKK